MKRILTFAVKSKRMRDRPGKIWKEVIKMITSVNADSGSSYVRIGFFRKNIRGRKWANLYDL